MAIRYVECEETDAEIVSVIRVTAPKGMEIHQFRVPLRRRQIGELDYPSRSSGFASDGWTREGFGFGCNGSYEVEDGTASAVTLSLSLFWTAIDHSRGSLAEKLRITVGKPGEKELPRKVKLAWTFEAPARKQRKGANQPVCLRDFCTA